MHGAFTGMKFVASKDRSKALQKNEWLIEKKGELMLVFSPLLKSQPKLAHAFSTRLGGESQIPFNSFNIGINQTTDENAKKDARENRQKLCATLGLPFEHLKTARKLVHSDRVVVLEKVEQPEDVDAIITQKLHSPVYMTYADCVPIIIYDAVKHVLALVHAGWRGTASGISRRAVESLIAEYNCQPSDLLCAVGPAIGACCYPVGLEAVEKLLISLIGNEVEEINRQIGFRKNENNWHDWSSLPGEDLRNATQLFWTIIEKADLTGFFVRGAEQIHVDIKAINGAQLMHSGVKHIDITDLCTACRKDLFYSFRRSFVEKEGPTGRQAAIACLT